MATEDDKVNTGALGTLVAVGTASMLGICLGVNALVRHEVGSMGAVREESSELEYRERRSEQLAKMHAPASRENGLIKLPIDRAMEMVMVDLKQNPWSASPPPPDAGVDAAAATEASDAGLDAAPSEAPDAGAIPEPPAPVPAAPAPVAPAPKPSVAPPAPRPTLVAPHPSAAPMAPVVPAPKAPTPTPPTTPSATP